MADDELREEHESEFVHGRPGPDDREFSLHETSAVERLSFSRFRTLGDEIAAFRQKFKPSSSPSIVLGSPVVAAFALTDAADAFSYDLDTLNYVVEQVYGDDPDARAVPKGMVDARDAIGAILQGIENAGKSERTARLANVPWNVAKQRVLAYIRDLQSSWEAAARRAAEKGKQISPPKIDAESLAREAILRSGLLESFDRPGKPTTEQDLKALGNLYDALLYQVKDRIVLGYYAVFRKLPEDLPHRTKRVVKAIEEGEAKAVRGNEAELGRILRKVQSRLNIDSDVEYQMLARAAGVRKQPNNLAEAVQALYWLLDQGDRKSLGEFANRRLIKASGPVARWRSLGLIPTVFTHSGLASQIERRLRLLLAINSSTGSSVMADILEEFLRRVADAEPSEEYEPHVRMVRETAQFLRMVGEHKSYSGLFVQPSVRRMYESIYISAEADPEPDIVARIYRTLNKVFDEVSPPDYIVRLAEKLRDKELQKTHSPLIWHAKAAQILAAAGYLASKQPSTSHVIASVVNTITDVAEIDNALDLSVFIPHVPQRAVERGLGRAIGLPPRLQTGKKALTGPQREAYTLGFWAVAPTFEDLQRLSARIQHEADYRLLTGLVGLPRSDIALTGVGPDADQARAQIAALGPGLILGAMAPVPEKKLAARIYTRVADAIDEAIFGERTKSPGKPSSETPGAYISAKRDRGLLASALYAAIVYLAEKQAPPGWERIAEKVANALLSTSPEQVKAKARIELKLIGAAINLARALAADNIAAAMRSEKEVSGDSIAWQYLSRAYTIIKGIKDSELQPSSRQLVDLMRQHIQDAKADFASWRKLHRYVRLLDQPALIGVLADEWPVFGNAYKILRDAERIDERVVSQAIKTAAQDLLDDFKYLQRLFASSQTPIGALFRQIGALQLPEDDPVKALTQLGSKIVDEVTRLGIKRPGLELLTMLVDEIPNYAEIRLNAEETRRLRASITRGALYLDGVATRLPHGASGLITQHLYVKNAAESLLVRGVRDRSLLEVAGRLLRSLGGQVVIDLERRTLSPFLVDEKGEHIRLHLHGMYGALRDLHAHGRWHKEFMHEDIWRQLIKAVPNKPEFAAVVEEDVANVLLSEPGRRLLVEEFDEAAFLLPGPRNLAQELTNRAKEQLHRSNLEALTGVRPEALEKTPSGQLVEQVMGQAGQQVITEAERVAAAEAASQLEKAAIESETKGPAPTGIPASAQEEGKPPTALGPEEPQPAAAKEPTATEAAAPAQPVVEQAAPQKIIGPIAAAISEAETKAADAKKEAPTKPQEPTLVQEEPQKAITPEATELTPQAKAAKKRMMEETVRLMTKREWDADMARLADALAAFANSKTPEARQRFEEVLSEIEGKAENYRRQYQVLIERGEKEAIPQWSVPKDTKKKISDAIRALAKEAGVLDSGMREWLESLGERIQNTYPTRRVPQEIAQENARLLSVLDRTKRLDSFLRRNVLMGVDEFNRLLDRLADPNTTSASFISPEAKARVDSVVALARGLVSAPQDYAKEGFDQDYQARVRAVVNSYLMRSGLPQLEMDVTAKAMRSAIPTAGGPEMQQQVPRPGIPWGRKALAAGLVGLGVLGIWEFLSNTLGRKPIQPQQPELRTGMLIPGASGRPLVVYPGGLALPAGSKVTVLE
ncbi:MAG: hypothetical protein RML36_15250 [Anaerolineae bacterium]|nr:hypothetical protein [Anaerolineae bacterium]